MTMPPPIEIDIAFCRAGLIILDENGAVYTSQVFGNSCDQISARGFFVPLDEALPEITAEPVEDALRKLVANAPYLSEHQADDVDVLLSKNTTTHFLRVDREMLTKSGEAWVHVDVLPSPDCPLKGHGPWKGILVWANTD